MAKNQARNATIGIRKGGRETPSLEDGLFGIFIEEMNFAHIQHQVNVLIHTRTDVPRNARDKCVWTGP